MGEPVHEAAVVCSIVRQRSRHARERSTGWTTGSQRPSRTGRPRFTANGVTPADFARVTASIETWPEWCAAWVAVGEQHEELGRHGARGGPPPVRRRAPRPGRGVLPLREVRLRRGPGPDEGRARAGRRGVHRRAAPPRPAGPPGRDPVRGQPAGRDRPHAVRRGAAPGGPDDPGPGLHQGGDPLDRADLPRPRSGDVQRRRAGTGRGGVRPARSAATGRPSPRRSTTRSAAARPGPQPARGVGGQPRRLLLRRASPPRSATGSAPASRWPARSTSGSAGTDCPP